MRLIEQLRERRGITLDDLASQVQIASSWGTLQSARGDNYQTLLDKNPVVGAAVKQREQMFAQAPPMWQGFANGQPGALSSDGRLDWLRTPWLGGSFAQLLSLWELDVSIAGNAYAYRWGGDIVVPDPAHVQAVIVQEHTHEGGPVVRKYVDGWLIQDPAQGFDPFIVDAKDMAHFKELPDRDRVRGRSWMRSAMTDIVADEAMSAHRAKFFELGATPNMVIKTEKKLDKEQQSDLVDMLARRHEGVGNAYRTMILQGGADFEVVGKDLKEVSFAETQSIGMDRISSASGVPTPVLQLVIGGQPTYNNMGEARRLFADSWARNQWRRAFEALNMIARPAPGKRLWYDERQIDALQNDAKDEADISNRQAATIRTYLDAGCKFESVIAAVNQGDLNLLEHSGLFSVQLQKPATDTDPNTEQEQP